MPIEHGSLGATLNLLVSHSRNALRRENVVALSRTYGRDRLDALDRGSAGCVCVVNRFYKMATRKFHSVTDAGTRHQARSY